MRADPLLLQRIAARGWTGRANSALPLSPLPGGGAGGAFGKAMVPVRDFFSRHGLPVKVQAPFPTCRRLDEELARQGFVVSGPTRVLTADVEAVTGEEADGSGVEFAALPDKEWLAACESWGRTLGGLGGELLGRHPRAGFASIRGDGNRIVAVGRVVVDDGWAGLSTAAVRPDHRRRGLATALMRARLRWARSRHGATRAYVQVEKQNSPSLAMCGKLGFAPHHNYHCRDEPS